MPALVAKSVQLLGIAKIQLGLFAHPFAQARFQRAVMGWIKWTERQGIFAALMCHHQHGRPVGLHRHDCRGEADGNSFLFFPVHKPTSGKTVVTPSITSTGGPIASSAASISPPRPRASSAWLTSSRLGWAWGARRRMARAISI